MSAPTDYRLYILLTTIIVSVGTSLSTMEWFVNRRQLMDDGLFSWRIMGTSRVFMVGPSPLASIVNHLLSYRSFLWILLIRFAAVLSLPLALWLDRGALLVLAVVLATSLLLHLRSPFGMDGSDQMATQIFGALFLGYLGGSTLALEASLWYIAGQSCLSYLTSGVAKALSPYWRRGDVVFAIFNTRTYGYAPVAHFLVSRPMTTKLLTWGAVAMECIFPLALFVGFPGCLVFIAWGVAFHLMNALVMGLNSFLWSFGATYPAVVYVAVVIQEFLRSTLPRG